MATQITDENLAEYLAQLGYSIEDAQEDTIEQVSELDDDVTLPGIKYQGGVMSGYIHMKIAVLKDYLDAAISTIQTAWNTWFGTSSASGVQKTWGDWFTGRQSEWDGLKTDAQSATTNANTAATTANTAATGASNVNAQLSGNTLTITNRQGQSSSINVSFEIYRTYASVSAMNADAANVPEGKFVMIATVSTTDPDNAKMYVRNASSAAQAFGFLCDLDQASSEAWADWLNNMKPVIEAAISSANTAATNANNKATIAEQKGNAAETKGNTAQAQGNTAESKGNTAQTQGNYAKSEGDRAKNFNDHPAYIGNDNYWYLWDYTTQAYVKAAYAKGDDLDYSTMTPEEYQRLIDNIKADLVFASDETCADIIDEL